MTHTIEITSLAYGGDGIGRIDGQVCFVPFGLPGDVVAVEIVRKAKGVLWGRILEVVEASPDRVQDTDSAGDGALRGTPSGDMAMDTGERARHAGLCGGCMWLHFAYPAQGEWKQRLVREALGRYGGIEAEVAWQEVPELRVGWRTRAEVHGDGRRLGFFAHGSHEIVETRCPLLHPKLADAIDRLRAAGWWREVTLTANPDGDEVLAFGKWPSERAPIDRAAVQAAVTAWDDPRDEGERAHFVYDGVPIWNGTFSQAGLVLNRLLREVVSECVQGTGALFDAYCGNGNLSLAYLTTREVVGVDVSEVAVAGARALGGDYRVGDEWAMGQCLRERAWGTIVLDPPRAGAKTLVPALAQARAEEMVYVGCDPVALARDLKGVVDGGWKVERVVALDLFPNTAHVETVVRLVR